MNLSSNRKRVPPIFNRMSKMYLNSRAEKRCLYNLISTPGKCLLNSKSTVDIEKWKNDLNFT